VAAVQECEQKKAQMIQKNAEKEKTLEEILGKVQNVFKEASLIQQSLPNSTLCVPVNDDAKLLPQPLYTLFSNKPWFDSFKMHVVRYNKSPCPNRFITRACIPVFGFCGRE
jgi:hypothetical protein